MNADRPMHPEDDALRETAARWTVRRERGLSAAESIEFELWLAADSRHPAALQRAAGAWAMLDRVSDSTAQRELAAAETTWVTGRRRVAFAWLGVAALVTAGFFVTWRSEDRADASALAAPALVAAGPRAVTLADGTLVRLNAGSEVVEDFDAAERRVRLTRGEAHFTVVKQPGRPFVVLAGALQVRAVGTAFNVNLQATQVEVLVTEGRVQLTREAANAAPAPAIEPELGPGERAVLTTSAPPAPAHAKAAPIVVTRLEPAEISRALAWHDSLVRLGGATLAELASEFERRFGQRVTIADPEIAQLRAGGRVRGDDAEGFANLLATTFDLEVERSGDGAWVLRKKKPVRDSGR